MAKKAKLCGEVRSAHRNISAHRGHAVLAQHREPLIEEQRYSEP
jgi:hypothetical protein